VAFGRRFEVVYRVGERGSGPTALVLNHRPLAFEREANPYRTGGAVVRREALAGRLGRANKLVVELA
jgi:hypothetical protein